jgi:exonuclease SbcC
LSEATYALKITQQQLNEHQQQQPDIKYEQLTELIHSNQDKLQQQLEQRDQYKLQLELHQQNLARQQQFADQIQQIQQQEHRWNKISSLIGDAKGKEFRDYAQQYHLDILVEHANQQLAMLSQRYTLKRLDQSLSLAIIDHDMDGEVRSVASLSGGESFLTALSLSLAIANMASGSMKIESLFIDEGFGTLDASSLHMVMNALDQLQNQGRKVVLISHIQDMHERIPVQIQVQPLGSGASQIEIVG